MEVRIQKKPIINDLSFTMNSDRINVFTGPNGAGKSTALRLTYLFLLESDNSINVEFGIYGRNSIGHLSAKHFLDINGINYSAHPYLLDLGINTDILNRKIKQLSSGECQKVFLFLAIQRCISGKKFLILDEPFTNLDDKSCTALEKILSQLLSDGKIILLSNHHWHFNQAINEIRL